MSLKVGSRIRLDVGDAVLVCEVKAIQRHQSKDPVMDGEPVMSLDELRMWYVDRCMDAFDGNRRKVCEVLGVNPSTLYRWMHR